MKKGRSVYLKEEQITQIFQALDMYESDLFLCEENSGRTDERDRIFTTIETIRDKLNRTR